MRRDAGFTLVELMIVAGLLLPLLGVLASSSKVVVGSLAANTVPDDLGNDVEAVADRVERWLRGASAASLQRPGVVGAWQPLADLDPTSAVELHGYAGAPLGAGGAAPPRRFGLDGDRLWTEDGARRLVLLTGVEAFSLERDGRLLTLRLTAVRESSGRTLRAAVHRKIYLRNP